MKVLVTGANGYLGQGIVKSLLDDEVEVVATDLTSQHIDERAEIYECDLFSQNQPYEFFGCPDVLLHLAWRDGFIHSSNSHLEDFSKHCAFIEKFAHSDVKTIAAMGSMHEIGKHEGCINDATPCNPQNFYGIAKNALRQVASVLCEENSKVFQWLRAYYIVGNSEFGSSIFSKITSAAKKGDATFPFTTGQNKFDFLDYDPFCNYVSKCVQQREINGVINVCSGVPEKLCDRVEKFIGENGYNIQLNYGAFPSRDYDSSAVWGDNSKINKILKLS